MQLVAEILNGTALPLHDHWVVEIWQLALGLGIHSDLQISVLCVLRVYMCMCVRVCVHVCVCMCVSVCVYRGEGGGGYIGKKLGWGGEGGGRMYL